jgi:uncharacterized protein
MLEIRQCCENCGKSLPNESNEAMICTFECTFCMQCVENILENVCPNCGGGFEKRPTRPNSQLGKYPLRNDKVFKPIEFNKCLETNRNIDPRKR